MMMMNVQGMTAQGASVAIGGLVGMLQQMVGRPVIDKTELKGLFDFTLQFSREGLSVGLPGGPPGGPTPFGPAGPGGPAPGPGGAGFAGPPPTATTESLPSLFSAIQDLGLRLESARGPVEVVVIDSVEKPTEN